MSYTALSAIAVVVAVALDLWLVRTRLLTTARWWLSYPIVLVGQLGVNGWLTGRRIVTYEPDTIIGSGGVQLFGDGRVVFAPVEDLGFGFVLVLVTLMSWTWWNERVDRRASPSR